MAEERAVVLEPSAVIEDFSKKTCEEKVEICGRLCYRSEDKITSESAAGFVTKIVENRHNTVLEMATKTFFIDDPEYFLGFEYWEMSDMKYLIMDACENGILITGSIRAFREAFFHLSYDALFCDIAFQIWKKHPTFFCDQEDALKDFEGTGQFTERDFTVREFSGFEFEELHRKYPRLYFRHKHVAVRFIVNRAVTHELVRHRPCSFLQESQRYCRYSQKKFGNRVTFIKPVFYDEGSEEYNVWEQSILQAENTYLKLLKTSSPQAARTVLPNSCKTEIIVFCSLKQWGHLFHLRTPAAAEPSMQQVMIPLYDDFVKKFFGVAEMLKERIPEGNN